MHCYGVESAPASAANGTSVRFCPLEAPPGGASGDLAVRLQAPCGPSTVHMCLLAAHSQCLPNTGIGGRRTALDAITGLAGAAAAG